CSLVSRLKKCGELHKNVELFADAIGFDPQRAVLYVNQASVYLKLLKPIVAIRDHDKAIMVNPDAVEGEGRHSASWVAGTRLPETSNKHTSLKESQRKMTLKMMKEPAERCSKESPGASREISGAVCRKTRKL
uniref:Uncharacterized protein n=1 Tax=Anser brachyrhynchus TaxID=132585 RepID=A0A8B9BX92_9AVES